MKQEVYFCPVNGWDCPYWNKDGSCQMDEKTAIQECDDAAMFDWDDEEEE